MNSDERMHERLTRAGARWRDVNTTPAHVDLEAMSSPEHGEYLVPITPLGADGPRRPRRSRVQMWLAAAVGVAAAASVAIVVANLGDGGSKRGQPATETGQSLTNTPWTLTGMNRADGTPLPVVAPASLTFTKDVIKGTDACNSISGKITIRASEPSEVAVSDLASTEMACVGRPDGFDAEVSHIHAVLDGTVQWSITGDELTLTNPGAGTLVYRHARQTRTTDPAALVGHAWQLALITQGTTSASPGSVASATSPTASISLIFNKNGTLSLTHRCYVVSATLSAADAKLRLTDVRAMQHSCPEIADPTARAAQEREDAVVDGVLRSTPSWFIDGGQLTVGDTLVFKAAGTLPASCAGDGVTDQFAIGDGSTTVIGTVPVGAVVAVTAEFLTRELTPPKTSSTALTALCSTTAGKAVTTYFRAIHAGTADVISATAGCPSCTQTTFVAHLTVLDAPDSGGGVATASEVTQGPGGASPGSPGSPGAASPSAGGPILYK